MVVLELWQRPEAHGSAVPCRWRAQRRPLCRSPKPQSARCLPRLRAPREIACRHLAQQMPVEMTATHSLLLPSPQFHPGASLRAERNSWVRGGNKCMQLLCRSTLFTHASVVPGLACFAADSAQTDPHLLDVRCESLVAQSPQAGAKESRLMVKSRPLQAVRPSSATYFSIITNVIQPITMHHAGCRQCFSYLHKVVSTSNSAESLSSSAEAAGLSHDLTRPALLRFYLYARGGQDSVFEEP